jgi:hypothetical protein
LGRAWLWLTGALALHVADEALTGFLDVYNPTVLAMRERWGWFPMPVLSFPEFLAGLGLLIAAMGAAAVAVYRGARWMRPVMWIFAMVMMANAMGHTLGTVFGRTVEAVRFERPMPGFYSSPFLFAAGAVLASRLRERSE